MPPRHVVLRNYDILAAVFSDIVKYMHNDLGLINEEDEEVAASEGHDLKENDPTDNAILAGP